MFKLIWVGAAPNLSEPQAIKYVSLQMMIDETFTFYCIFHEVLHYILGFDVCYA